MKRIIIILTTIILLVSGCGVKSTKKENLANDTTLIKENDSILRDKMKETNKISKKVNSVSNINENNNSKSKGANNNNPIASEVEELNGLIASKIKLKVDYSKIDLNNLQRKIDWSQKMPPVKLQTVSCNAWASIYNAKTYYEGLEEGWDVTKSEHQFSPS